MWGELSKKLKLQFAIINCFCNYRFAENLTPNRLTCGNIYDFIRASSRLLATLRDAIENSPFVQIWTITFENVIPENDPSTAQFAANDFWLDPFSISTDWFIEAKEDMVSSEQLDQFSQNLIRNSFYRLWWLRKKILSGWCVEKPSTHSHRRETVCLYSLPQVISSARRSW